MIVVLLAICLLLAVAYCVAEIVFERDWPRHFSKYVLLFTVLLLCAIGE